MVHRAQHLVSGSALAVPSAFNVIMIIATLCTRSFAFEFHHAQTRSLRNQLQQQQLKPIARKCSAFVATAGASSLSAKSNNNDDDVDEHAEDALPKRVAVVGGGLAGLSITFHLLQKQPNIDITIFDKSAVGCGGASAVAGGLLHPLSPRGKLVFLGMESLKCTNAMVDEARKHLDLDDDHGPNKVVLLDEIYRVATTDKHVGQLQSTATRLPHICEWLGRDDLIELPMYGETFRKESSILGGLRMHSGCRVIHVPSYLKSLYKTCCSMSAGSIKWVQDAQTEQKTKEAQEWYPQLKDFDAVAFSAGSGLFEDAVLSSIAGTQDATDGEVTNPFPITLVRGQSIELVPHEQVDEGAAPAIGSSMGAGSRMPAMLCGKYLSPLPTPGRMSLGATHEFKTKALDAEQVVAELKDRSYSFAKEVWDSSKVSKITGAKRVQSNRGNFGRLPIAGKLDTPIHNNAWILTGLSSRGLLYHGIYGRTVATMMLQQQLQDHEKEGSDDVTVDVDTLDWWRTK